MADRGARDGDGFPWPNESLEGDLYRDEFEIVWVCQWYDGLDQWVWVVFGRL